MANKKIVIGSRMITSIIFGIVITALVIPSITSYEIDRQTISNVKTFEGLYVNGTVLEIDNLNKNHIESMFSSVTIIGTENNNDSYYIGTTGSLSVQDFYYGNWITYIGNNTYSITANYSHHNKTSYVQLKIGIPINITLEDFAEFEFIRIVTNANHTGLDTRMKVNGLFFPSSVILIEKLNEKTYIRINTVSLKNNYNTFNSDDEKIYIEFNNLDLTDSTFTFKIEGFNLADEHKLSYDSENVYFGSIISIIFVMVISVLLISTLIRQNMK